MKGRAELGIIILLPILILGILVFNAQVMSTHYMALEGLDPATKVYGEQFSATKQTIEGVPGQTLSINVTVKNTSNFIWPQAGPNPVHMSYHILDANRKVVTFEGLRSDLPTDLRPGQQITMPLTVKVSEQPGSYLIELDMVQEGMAWLGERAGVTYLVKVQEK